jgi:amino acid transporter
MGAESHAAVVPSGQRKLRREVGMVGLLFASVGSIIGSGWLFGALNSSLVAGPAAIISWILGGAAVMLLALIHAELGGMYPVAGGSARFPHYAFGSLIGFSSGWFAFIGAVTTAPIEVEAALTYGTAWVSKYFGFDLIDSQGLVTTAGFVVAAVLMLLFATINVLGVKWLSETNKVAVWWKIAIPVLAVIVLIAVAFHPGNFTAGGGFSPFGWKGIFQAIPIGGVIFAYLGFEQAIQLGAETRNPKRNIPLAVIGSMILGVVLYLGLDLAFVGAINPNDLSHGWHNLSKVFNGTYGPFAAIFTSLGLTFMAVLIYIDAVISPGGTGLLYVGTSARLTFALARNRYIPAFFATLSARGVPVFAIAFSFIVGMIVFLPFPSWAALVGFISSATVIAYAMAPLAMGALRMQDPGRERPFKLWGGTIPARIRRRQRDHPVLWLACGLEAGPRDHCRVRPPGALAGDQLVPQSPFPRHARRCVGMAVCDRAAGHLLLQLVHPERPIVAFLAEGRKRPARLRRRRACHGRFQRCHLLSCDVAAPAE